VDGFVETTRCKLSVPHYRLNVSVIIPTKLPIHYQRVSGIPTSASGTKRTSTTANVRWEQGAEVDNFPRTQKITTEVVAI
jgi:hypothetical protein